jgi:hypothetical protein
LSVHATAHPQEDDDDHSYCSNYMKNDNDHDDDDDDDDDTTQGNHFYSVQDLLDCHGEIEAKPAERNNQSSLFGPQKNKQWKNQEDPTRPRSSSRPATLTPEKTPTNSLSMQKQAGLVKTLECLEEVEEENDSLRGSSHHDNIDLSFSKDQGILLGHEKQ